MLSVDRSELSWSAKDDITSSKIFEAFNFCLKIINVGWQENSTSAGE